MLAQTSCFGSISTFLHLFVLITLILQNLFIFVQSHNLNSGQKIKLVNMPFIKLYTTLSKDKLPERFMPQLVEELSVIISKDKKWFNWILETDKCMSKVSLLLKCGFRKKSFIMNTHLQSVEHICHHFWVGCCCIHPKVMTDMLN